MRVLIAEDDPVSRRLIEATLQKWGYDVIATQDGSQAIAEFEKPDPPRLAVLDWMMPGVGGTEVARKLREREDGDLFYILLLTAKQEKDDIVEGLHSGADDYVTKPFHRDELAARLNVGKRIIELQQKLQMRVMELERALAEVRQLQGLLPICAYCKRIRETDDYWESVEAYISSHSGAEFSHGICPDCFEKHVQRQIDTL